MRASHFSANYKLSGVFGVCLCLAVVGSIIVGTAVSAPASAATASPPEIRAFSADPMAVKDGDSVLYSFDVWNATAVQINEAGDVIKLIKSAPSSVLKGTVRGRTTYQIRMAGSSSFDTVLVASNPGGKREKKLTIKFATALTARSASTGTGQTGGTDNQTRTPKWLDQITPAIASIASGASKPGAEPSFFKCPNDCNYCLKPEDAAGRGFTQRCSEQPCYYSPDDQQKWYCFRKPATIWCCDDGKVVETTKDACAQAGGSYYATEAEALKACQAMMGWYCVNGEVYQGTRAQATQAGVGWYTTQAEAARYCSPAGWCCRSGQIGQTTQSQCSQLGGYWFATQGEAVRACQVAAMGWYCYGGRIYQGTQAQAAQSGANWYATQAEAARVCQQQTIYWCCSNGQVYQTTTFTTGCYKTQAEAISACQQQASCWCCSGGKAFQTSQAACSRSGGACYSTQSQATAACYRTLPPTLK